MVIHKKRNILLIVLLFAFIFAGCSLQRNDKVVLSDSLQKPPVYFGFFDDNNLLYYQEDNSKVTFFIYDNKIGETLELGTIENYILDTGFTTLVNNRLYYYAGIINHEGEIRNTLFSIDMQSHEISRHDNPDMSLPGVNVFSSGKNVVTLKNERANEIITTYLEFYNTDKSTWEKNLVNKFNELSKTGSALYVMYADDTHIYIIQDVYEQNGKYESYFIQYNQLLEEEKRILLKDDVASFIQAGNGRIIELKIFDDYLYLRDLSGNGFLGKIEQDKIEKVMSADQFLPAASLYHNAMPIFFIREDLTLFALDTKTGELTEYLLNSEEGHSIAQVWHCNDQFLIIAWDESRLQMQYFVDFKELEQLEI